MTVSKILIASLSFVMISSGKIWGDDNATCQKILDKYQVDKIFTCGSEHSSGCLLVRGQGISQDVKQKLEDDIKKLLPTSEPQSKCSLAERAEKLIRKYEALVILKKAHEVVQENVKLPPKKTGIYHSVFGDTYHQCKVDSKKPFDNLETQFKNVLQKVTAFDFENAKETTTAAEQFPEAEKLLIQYSEIFQKTLGCEKNPPKSVDKVYLRSLYVRNDPSIGARFSLNDNLRKRYNLRWALVNYPTVSGIGDD